LGFESVLALICDVDGVLTDGRVVLGSGGLELKSFHVADGTGIKYLLRSGIGVGFLTGRESDAVARRAEELGVAHVRQGAKDKLPAYESLAAALGVPDEGVCYVGDDLPDLPVLRRVGCPVAVADAREEVRAVAHYVTEAPGGHGAVRELAEHILKARDRWAAILSRYAD
jgi:YrbI family 3-deoxy-D-manno-octulosonate 8-phosphate phosphatase